MKRVGVKFPVGIKFMRHLLCTTLLMALAALSVAVAQSTLHTVSIALSMKENSVKAGSKIWVDVVTTNLSNHPVGPGFYPGPLEGWDFSTKIELLDSQGKPVALKGPDQSACKGDPKCKVVYSYGGSYVPVTLDPGKSFKDGFLISQLYDLSQPGTYTIQAVRRDKGTGGAEKSNLLTFTVTP